MAYALPTMKLQQRLVRVGRQVLSGTPMADVGTDHGQLPVWLVQEELVPSAIAMDLRPGPLSVARRQVARAGVSDQVQTRLSDGMAALQPGEVSTVTVCGMGGVLIARILKARPDVLASLQRVVLQPNTDAHRVRQALQALSWRIVDEDLLIDGKYIYPIIAAEPSPVSQRYSREDIEFGPILRQRRPPELAEVLRRRADHVRGILARCQGSAEATERFSRELSMIESEQSLL